MTAAERQALKAEVDRRRREQVKATPYAYVDGCGQLASRKCPCEICKAVRADRMRAWRARGGKCNKSANSYKNGCRCDDCKQANKLYLIAKKLSRYDR